MRYMISFLLIIGLLTTCEEDTSSPVVGPVFDFVFRAHSDNIFSFFPEGDESFHKCILLINNGKFDAYYILGEYGEAPFGVMKKIGTYDEISSITLNNVSKNIIMRYRNQSIWQTEEIRMSEIDSEEITEGILFQLIWKTEREHIQTYQSQISSSNYFKVFRSPLPHVSIDLDGYSRENIYFMKGNTQERRAIMYKIGSYSYVNSIEFEESNDIVIVVFGPENNIQRDTIELIQFFQN